jgi:putative transposase
MGRRPRQDREGGWHHVMNRGAGRHRVFFRRSDGEAFEQLLADAAAATAAEIHAYCLMPNHFHLLVRMPTAGLSQFMHRVTAPYARRLNALRDSDGPVFRGRFTSITVDCPEYLDRVGRYIHRNPADLSTDPLECYRWSSYRHYVTPLRPPEWLTTSALLDFHGGRASYRAFVAGEQRAAAIQPGLLRWSIHTALDEIVTADEFDRHSLEGVVLHLMIDQSTGEEARILEAQINASSASARRMARVRARRRAQQHPVLHQVATRALELAR